MLPPSFELTTLRLAVYLEVFDETLTPHPTH